MAQIQARKTRTGLVGKYEIVARMATKSRGANIHPNHQKKPPNATFESIRVRRGKKNIKNMNTNPWCSQKLV
jgi:hypothetical protein